VAPARVGRHVVHEQVEPVGLRLAVHQDTVGREGGHGHLHADVLVVVDDAVVEDVLQDGRHRRDGERVAHGRRRLSRNASSAWGRGREASAGFLAEGAGAPSTARTSMRPIRTCTTSGTAGGAAWETAVGRATDLGRTCTSGRRDTLTEATGEGGAASAAA